MPEFKNKNYKNYKKNPKPFSCLKCALRNYIYGIVDVVMWYLYTNFFLFGFIYIEIKIILLNK